MKKRLISLLAALVMALCACTADADMIDDAFAGLDLSQEQQTEFRALISQIGGTITAAQLQEMVDAYAQTLQTPVSPDALQDGRYTLPSGLSVPVPDGWQALETQGVASLLLVGEAVNGVTPSISVMEFEGEQAEFETADQAYWDEKYSAVLPNFKPGSLDTFMFENVTAHEYFCYYGRNNETQRVQYQMYFNREGRAYVITMTVADSVAAFLDALDAYDAVRNNMSFEAVGQANG